MKVKNMSVEDDGYDTNTLSGESWKDLFIEQYCIQYGKDVDECCCNKNCVGDADYDDIVGAHVKTARGDEYMTLLCKKCNNAKNTSYMDVYKDDLIPLEDINALDEEKKIIEDLDLDLDEDDLFKW